MKRVAEALGVSRSNLAQRSGGRTLARGAYVKADDKALLKACHSEAHLAGEREQ